MRLYIAGKGFDFFFVFFYDIYNFFFYFIQFFPPEIIPGILVRYPAL